MPSSPTALSPAAAMDALEEYAPLDRLTAPLQKAVRALPLGPLRDVLHGRQVGHPVHPALVQLPLGTWMSAAVLDVLPGAGRSARTLVGVGVLAAAPAAWAGWVDWAEQDARQRRVGVVHAAGNVLAVSLYAASWVARGRGQSGWGRLLGFAGLSTVSLSGLLGGHLAYRQGGGVNQAVTEVRPVGPGWHELGPAAAFAVDRPARAHVGEVPVLVVRQEDGEVRVLADRCSHLSGPLSEGEVADGCVTCPWHGSVFRLSDGWNLRGPATAPQPAFDTRVTTGGVLEVRLRGTD